MKTKICYNCKQELDVLLFSKDKNRKDGLRLDCKKCCSDNLRKWREANRERYLEQNRIKSAKYKIKHKEKIKLTKERNKAILAAAKNRAKRKNVPFDIEAEDICIPEYCPILNIKLVLTNKISENNSPSLDRIIPELGYVKGNIQVISMLANNMKSNASFEELKLFAEWIKENIV